MAGYLSICGSYKEHLGEPSPEVLELVLSTDVPVDYEVLEFSLMQSHRNSLLYSSRGHVGLYFLIP